LTGKKNINEEGYVPEHKRMLEELRVLKDKNKVVIKKEMKKS
jgi:hypothetical protein